MRSWRSVELRRLPVKVVVVGDRGGWDHGLVGLVEGGRGRWRRFELADGGLGNRKERRFEG